MIKEFTFICICYNQKDLIVRHLNSVKEMVLKYGEGIENHLIVADDCSKDGTIDIVNKWISENTSIFVETKVISQRQNIGSVKNMYSAIDACKTEEFKILAGDDFYYHNNIYKLYNNISNVIITPVIPEYPEDNKDEVSTVIKSMKRSLKMVSRYVETNELSDLIRIKNHIMAPGVMVPSKYWRDPEIKQELLKFKYIEDVPLWFNVFVKRKAKADICYEPFVYYRLPTRNRLINDKTIHDIRRTDTELIKKLYYQDSVKPHIKIKYIIYKILFSFTRDYEDKIGKNKDLAISYSIKHKEGK